MMLDAFRTTCFIRSFELAVIDLIKAGRIKAPTYLCLGSEHVAPAVMTALGTTFCRAPRPVDVGSPSRVDQTNKSWHVFAQHRCHGYYIACGGDPAALLRELMGRKDGCNGGMAGSASCSVPDRMFGHSGLLGDQAPIAVGYAAATGRPTICVLGDGACEEDYVLGAIGHAVTTEAPVLFVVEDNELSVSTSKPKRRSWSIERVARGFGMGATRTSSHPECIKDSVKTFSKHLPALIEVPVIRACAHNSTRDQSHDLAPFYFTRWLTELGEQGWAIMNEEKAKVQQLVEETTCVPA